MNDYSHEVTLLYITEHPFPERVEGVYATVAAANARAEELREDYKSRGIKVGLVATRRVVQGLRHV